MFYTFSESLGRGEYEYVIYFVQFFELTWLNPGLFLPGGFTRMRITKIHILRFLKSMSHFVATVSIYKAKLVNSSGKSINTGL